MGFLAFLDRGQLFLHLRDLRVIALVHKKPSTACNMLLTNSLVKYSLNGQAPIFHFSLHFRLAVVSSERNGITLLP